MPFFQYRARDKQGGLVTGNMEAADHASLESALDKMGLIPTKVVSRSKAPRNLPDIKSFFKKVPQQDLILFSRQLATLFSAGVPLTRAIFSLERQATSPVFRDIIKKLREDIEAGSSFANAIKKHPSTFPELYASMVEAGEAGGILDNVLDRLALMLEKNAENRAKVKSATLYPKIVIAAIIIAVIVLMTFVIPKFSKLYASFKVALPLPTRMLIGISNGFVSYWYIIFGGAIAGFVILRLYVSTEAGRLRWDSLRLSIPIFGPLVLKSILSRFARVLGSLYKSGLPILQSIDIVSRAVENRVISREVKAIENEVRSGKSLSEPMASSPNFPPMVVQMIKVGEDTGNLDDMLEKVAEYYDQEVDTTIRNLTTTLEPVLLAFIFGMVLFLALAIFLPMWDILKIVRVK